VTPPNVTPPDPPVLGARAPRRPRARPIRGVVVGAAFPPGGGPVSVLLAGEAPGPQGCDQSGHPFVGDLAGLHLFRALVAAGRATFPPLPPGAAPPVWDGAAMRDAGYLPTLHDTAVTNAYPACPTVDGFRFVAPTRAQVESPENLARLRGELAEARARGLRAVVALGRAADRAFGAVLGLRDDPALRYHALCHPSAQGLLTTAPNRGKGASITELEDRWVARLAEILGDA
jgi:hypothetical protein